VAKRSGSGGWRLTESIREGPSTAPAIGAALVGRHIADAFRMTLSVGLALTFSRRDCHALFFGAGGDYSARTSKGSRLGAGAPFSRQPHSHLDRRTPAFHYQASPRPFPTRLPPQESPEHFLVNKITTFGTFRFVAMRFQVVNAIAHHHIGLAETDDGI